MGTKYTIGRFLSILKNRLGEIVQHLKKSWTSNKPRWIVVSIITLGSFSPLLILFKIIAPSISLIDKALYLPIILAMILSIHVFLKAGIAILKDLQLPLHPLETARLTFFSVILAFSISNAFTFGSLHLSLEENMFFYLEMFTRNFCHLVGLSCSLGESFSWIIV